MILIALLSALLSAPYGQSSNLTVQGNARIKGGHMIIDTAAIKNNVALDVASRNLSDTAQIGVYVEPSFGIAATSGGAGVRIWPRTNNGSGHLPYVHMLDVYPPTFGTSSGGKFVYGIYLNDINGSDSGNYALYTNRGINRFGDTSYFQKMVQFNAAIQYHGRLVSTSQTVTDTDYIILADIASARVVDTLPALATSLGRYYIFIQYSTAGVGNFVIKPRAGEKIETSDSICMRSNIGISKVILVNASTKWRILYQHEEGTFSSTLTGVSGAWPGAVITDTGSYVRDNQDIFFRIKPLVGTSNATTFTVTGADSRMTYAGLDTTQTCQTTVAAWNNSGKVAADCVYGMSAGLWTCENVSSGFTAWTAALAKGLRFGLETRCHFPGQPTY